MIWVGCFVIIDTWRKVLWWSAWQTAGIPAFIKIIGVVALAVGGGGTLKSEECTKEHQWSMVPNSGYVQVAAKRSRCQEICKNSLKTKHGEAAAHKRRIQETKR